MVHIFYILKPPPDPRDPRETIHSHAEHVWVIRVISQACHQWRTIAFGCPALVDLRHPPRLWMDKGNAGQI
jgi:hypothetical protein